MRNYFSINLRPLWGQNAKSFLKIENGTALLAARRAVFFKMFKTFKKPKPPRPSLREGLPTKQSAFLKRDDVEIRLPRRKTSSQ